MIVVPENKKAQVLLVEDNEGDAEIIRQNFESGSVPTCVNIVRDGIEALDYLRKNDRFSAAKRPDIIILDLNLPKRDGRELLDTIKQDPVLRIIPVIVFTNSLDDRDIIMSYVLQANSYVMKPLDYEEFSNALNEIKNFWLRTVRLP